VSGSTVTFGPLWVDKALYSMRREELTMVAGAVRLFDSVGWRSLEGSNVRLRRLEVLELILPPVAEVTD
jgi:hypothetical protein